MGGGGSCGICKKSASEKIANDLKNEMNLTGREKGGGGRELWDL